MKKVRQDQPNPISLSSKRHSLQQDKLIVAQKTDWNTPLQTMDSNHNKTFFSTMKAELSNIRSDYERLIQREDKNTTLGLREKEIIELKGAWGTADKQKSYSSYKQEQRYFTEKKSEADATVKQKEGQDQAVKGFNLAKNFSEAVNFKNKHITAREREPFTSNNPVGKYISLEVKEEEVKESNYSSHNPKKYSTNFNEATNDKELLLQRIENQRKKEFSAKLQQEISIYKVESTRSKAELAMLSEENSVLKERVAVLAAEIAAKTEKMKIDDENIAKYKGAAEKAEKSEKLLAVMERELVELHGCMKHEREEREKEVNFYGQKINELTFYNNNFFKDNSQLTEENRQLKEVIASMQKLNEDSKRMDGQNELDWQRKMDHLQKNLKEYEKRELMFEKEIEHLCQQINAQPEESSLESMARQPQSEHSNSYLEEQMHSLRTELAKQQEINTLLVRKYKEQIQKMNIEAITFNLDQTIQQLSDQNGQLKNECNFLSSKIKQLEEQNHAYCAQIQLYEERDKFKQANRSLTTSEWEEMTQKIQQLTSKIQQLTTENRRLTEDIDYKQLLQEVLTQQKSFNVALDAKDEFESLLITAKDQLDEIQKLRFEVEKLQIKLRVCEEERQDLRTQKLRLEEEVKAFISCQAQSEPSRLMNKYEQLRVSFEQRQRALRELKQFVRQNLAGRINDTQLC